MSVELYTQEQIVHHVENASPTKFMYSFSRAERFPKSIEEENLIPFIHCPL